MHRLGLGCLRLVLAGLLLAGAAPRAAQERAGQPATGATSAQSAPVRSPRLVSLHFENTPLSAALVALGRAVNAQLQLLNDRLLPQDLTITLDLHDLSPRAALAALGAKIGRVPVPSGRRQYTFVSTAQARRLRGSSLDQRQFGDWQVSLTQVTALASLDCQLGSAQAPTVSRSVSLVWSLVAPDQQSQAALLDVSFEVTAEGRPWPAERANLSLGRAEDGYTARLLLTAAPGAPLPSRLDLLRLNLVLSPLAEYLVQTSLPAPGQPDVVVPFSDVSLAISPVPTPAQATVGPADSSAGPPRPAQIWQAVGTQSELPAVPPVFESEPASELARQLLVWQAADADWLSGRLLAADGSPLLTTVSAQGGRRPAPGQVALSVTVSPDQESGAPPADSLVLSWLRPSGPPVAHSIEWLNLPLPSLGESEPQP